MSADDPQVTEVLKRTARSESVNIFEYDSIESNKYFPCKTAIGLKKRLNRSGSEYVEPKISDYVIEKSERYLKNESVVYLKERGFLRHML